MEFYDYVIFAADGFFQAVGRERGQFRIGTETIDLRIRTSRTYVLDSSRYRQLHHHGSIEEPKLLEAYQKAVIAGTIE